MNRSLRRNLIAVLVLIACSSMSQAVPSFSRQTGLPCVSCHYTYPELTNFGRMFKLNGYTLTGIKQIVVKGTPRESPLRIDQFLPLSAFIQLSTTGTNKPQPGTQNWSDEFPQALSLFFAGGISEHAGAFVQATYSGADDHFGIDQIDIRYARRTKFVGKDFLWGINFDNQPTTEDVWNSTPVWRFPWGTPDAAPSPAAVTVIDGPLAADVAGFGAYALWNNHLYTDVTVFRTAHIGAPQPNQGVGFDFNIAGAAPYWRVAWQQNFNPSNYLEVGTFGTHISSYPGAIVGPKNFYDDNAADAQFEHHIGNDVITAHAVYIYQKASLGASVLNGVAGNVSQNLKTVRYDGTYHLGTRYTLTAGGFSTNGSADNLLYAPGAAVTGSANSKPTSTGYILQAGWWPVQNVEVLGQYTGYTKFNGAGSNYDGLGRNASDNNGVYFLLWFAF